MEYKAEYDAAQLVNTDVSSPTPQSSGTIPSLQFGYGNALIQSARAARLKKEASALVTETELDFYLKADLVDVDPLALDFDVVGWWRVRFFYYVDEVLLLTIIICSHRITGMYTQFLR